MRTSEHPVPILVYLYGPPAVGKLTVAERLSAVTGWPLFHNHLSVNTVRPIFAFGSQPFTDVVHRLRLDVFKTAMAEGMSLIFTNNSAWGGVDGRARFIAFAESARAATESGGGRVQFVRLTAPGTVLKERLANPARRQLEKLLDPSRLRELLASLDDAALSEDDLTVDTSEHTPAEAASAMNAHLSGRRYH
jgi:shikimate kinase